MYLCHGADHCKDISRQRTGSTDDFNNRSAGQLLCYAVRVINPGRRVCQFAISRNFCGNPLLKFSIFSRIVTGGVPFACSVSYSSTRSFLIESIVLSKYEVVVSVTISPVELYRIIG